MKNLVIFPLKYSKDFNGFWFHSGNTPRKHARFKCHISIYQLHYELEISRA